MSINLEGVSGYTVAGRGRKTVIIFDNGRRHSIQELSKLTGIYQRALYSRVVEGVSFDELIHPGKMFVGALGYLEEHGFICRTVCRENFDLTPSQWKTFVRFLHKNKSLVLVDLPTPSSAYYFVRKGCSDALPAAENHAYSIAVSKRREAVIKRAEIRDRDPWWIRLSGEPCCKITSSRNGVWSWYSLGGS